MQYADLVLKIVFLATKGSLEDSPLGFDSKQILEFDFVESFPKLQRSGGSGSDLNVSCVGGSVHLFSSHCLDCAAFHDNGDCTWPSIEAGHSKGAKDMPRSRFLVLSRAVAVLNRILASLCLSVERETRPIGEGLVKTEHVCGTDVRTEKAQRAFNAP